MRLSPRWALIMAPVLLATAACTSSASGTPDGKSQTRVTVTADPDWENSDQLKASPKIRPELTCDKFDHVGNKMERSAGTQEAAQEASLQITDAIGGYASDNEKSLLDACVRDMFGHDVQYAAVLDSPRNFNGESMGGILVKKKDGTVEIYSVSINQDTVKDIKNEDGTTAFTKGDRTVYFHSAYPETNTFMGFPGDEERLIDSTDVLRDIKGNPVALLRRVVDDRRIPESFCKALWWSHDPKAGQNGIRYESIIYLPGKGFKDVDLKLFPNALGKYPLGKGEVPYIPEGCRGIINKKARKPLLIGLTQRS